MSATSRPFWADIRAPRNFALVSIIRSSLLRRWRWRGRSRHRRSDRRRPRRAAREALRRTTDQRGLAFGRVALEHARVSELAQFVADHVFRDEHGNVLLAVVHGN